MILKIRFRIAMRYKQTAAVLHADRKQATGSALPVCDQKILSSTSVSPFMPRKKRLAAGASPQTSNMWLKSPHVPFYLRKGEISGM